LANAWSRDPIIALETQDTLWSTISGTSIWRKKLCSLSKILLAQKCVRYER
jgi:hypothetical protein